MDSHYGSLLKHIQQLKHQMEQTAKLIDNATFDRPYYYKLVIEEGYVVDTELMNQHLLKTISYVLSNGGFKCNIFISDDKSYYALEILLDEDNRAYNPIIMSVVSKVHNDDTSVIAKIKITPGLHKQKIVDVVSLLETSGLIDTYVSANNSDTKFSLTFQKTFKVIYDESILDKLKDTEIISSLDSYRDLAQSTALIKMGLLNTSLKIDVGHYSTNVTLTQHKYIPLFTD